MPDKSIEVIIADFCQRVSYDFYDMIEGYPPYMRAIALAAVRACIESQLAVMPPEIRALCDEAVQKMTVTVLPKELDPRKFEQED